jgi:DNA repair exonuclease SbcCD nuclease subunit
MKIANIADIHFRGKDLAACREQMMAAADACAERKVDLAAILGDLLDRPSVGDNHASTGAVAEAAIAGIKALTHAGIEVLMIPGNHDQGGAGSQDALHIFDGMDKVRVIRQPFIHSFFDGRDQIHIAFLPWSWDGADPAQILEGFGPCALLLGHVEVIGAKMGGTRCCEAVPGKWQVGREFLESLPFDYIALGHFHTRQRLFGERGGYVGALRQCNFNEEGNPAGLEIYDTETKQAEWIELDAAPKYRTWTVSDHYPNDPIITDDTEKDHVRVVYDGIAPDPVEVRQFENAGIRVEQIVEREERVRRAEVPEGILADRHGLIRLWAGSQNPPVENGRLEKMLALHDGLFADRGGETTGASEKSISEQVIESVEGMEQAAATPF